MYKQGKEEGAAIFLVNEFGVIVSIAARHMHAHVTHVQSRLAHGAPLAQSHEGNETSRTDAQVALEQAKVMIAELEADLHDVRADLSATKTALAKEKIVAAATTVHKDELEKKDTEIAKLRAQLEQYLAIGSEGQYTEERSSTT